MIIVAILTASTTLGANAQKLSTSKVPANVKSAFATTYPTAKSVQWEKEKTGEYEVNFEQGQEEMSVVYNAQGIALEVEVEIAASDLPAAVQNALKGKKIKEAARITKGGKTYYEAEVGGKDLLFDTNGQALPATEG